jgi:hypothetical protein
MANTQPQPPGRRAALIKRLAIGTSLGMAVVVVATLAWDYHASNTPQKMSGLLQNPHMGEVSKSGSNIQNGAEHTARFVCPPFPNALLRLRSGCSMSVHFLLSSMQNNFHCVLKKKMRIPQGMNCLSRCRSAVTDSSGESVGTASLRWIDRIIHAEPLSVNDRQAFLSDAQQVYACDCVCSCGTWILCACGCV